VNIPISKVLPNPEQPRKHFDEDDLAGLAQSIQENGVIQPVIVEEAGDQYILHDGERRLRAAKLAGLTEIPAHINPPLNGTGGQDRLVRALVANVQHSELNPVEEGNAYLRMHNELGMSVDEIARTVGVSRPRVEGRMKWPGLDPEIQDLVAGGRIHRDPRLADALLEIPTSEARVETARHIAKHALKLKSALKAAERVASALVIKDKKIRSPGLTLAKQQAEIETDSPPEWDALYQVNRVPPWPVITEAAMQTCDLCALRSIASRETCGPCPLVVFLRGALEAAR
jgi:ParB family chromosome partitioning protein